MPPLWSRTTQLVTPGMRSRDAVSNPSTSNIYGYSGIQAHVYINPLVLHLYMCMIALKGVSV